jgi:hypothetical protein
MNDSERPADGLVCSATGETSVSHRLVRKPVRNFTFMFLSQGFTWALSIILLIVGPASSPSVGRELRFVQTFVGRSLRRSG